MNDLVEIGVYAVAEDGKAGAPLYLRTHRIPPGRQRGGFARSGGTPPG